MIQSACSGVSLKRQHLQDTCLKQHANLCLDMQTCSYKYTVKHVIHATINVYPPASLTKMFHGNFLEIANLQICKVKGNFDQHLRHVERSKQNALVAQNRNCFTRNQNEFE